MDGNPGGQADLVETEEAGPVALAALGEHQDLGPGVRGQGPPLHHSWGGGGE